PYTDVTQLEGLKTVDHLRNGYTGGEATQVGSPSPGNFRITCAGSSSKYKIEAFGDNGRVVYMWDQSHMSDGWDGPPPEKLAAITSPVTVTH
ncbi:MAG: hypothetical protein ACREJQ_02100, partial [bacterium]